MSLCNFWGNNRLNESSLQPFYALLYEPAPSRWLMWATFFILLSMSAFIALITVNVSIKHLGNKKKSVFLFLLVTQTFTPIIGNVIVIMAIFMLKRYKTNIYPVQIATFHTPIYIRTTPISIPAYAEGWAFLRLNSPTFPENERKQALIALNRGAQKNTNRIYQQLVSDEMEELRICAFSLLELQQNQIHASINSLLKIYTNATYASNKAFYAKQLALLYWELIYLNLGDKEFRNVILNRCAYYANIANDILQQDPIVLIILSRIAYSNQDEKTGAKMLQAAKDHHAPNSKVDPYLAEARFLARDFEHISSYLSYDKSFEFILKLNPLVKFWCHKNHD